MATVPTNVPAGKTIQLTNLPSMTVPTNVPAGTTVGLTNTAPKTTTPNVPYNVPAGVTVQTSTPYNIPAGTTASLVNGNGTTGTWNQNGTFTLAAPGYGGGSSSSGGSSGGSLYSAPSQQSSIPSLSSLMNTPSSVQTTPSAPAQSGQSVQGNSGGTLGGILGNGYNSNYSSLYDAYKNASAPTDYSSLDPLNNDLTEAKKAYQLEKQSMTAARAKMDANATSSPVTSQFYNASAGAIDRNYGARLANASSLESSLSQDLLSRVALLDKQREQRIQQAKAGLEEFKAMNPDETFTAYGNNPSYLQFIKAQTAAKENPLDAAYKQAQIANIQDQINNRGYSWRTDPITGQSYQVRNAGDTGGVLGGSYGGSYGSSVAGGSVPTSVGIARAAGAAPANLQPYLQALQQNPSLYNTWSQNVRQAITPYLQQSGVNLSDLTLKPLSDTEQNNLASFDTQLSQLNSALKMFQDGTVSTGPISNRYNEFANSYLWGGDTQYNNLNSILSDITSSILNRRFGSAVTEQEYQRLQGMIPDLSQNQQEGVVKQKIENLINTLSLTQQNAIKRSTQQTYQVNQQPQQPSGQVGYINGQKYINNGNGWVPAQ